MNKKIIILVLVVVALVLVSNYYKKDTSMSFFVTSVNPGNGGDLGGLLGADAYCTALAESAGVNGKIWRAYLSTTGEGGVNARDRIGNGPWYNAKGELVADDIESLHGYNGINKITALTETGMTVMGRGDDVNMHDILTGSLSDGTASTTAVSDTTCANWTSSTVGSAIVGHHDRVGLDDSSAAKSWNSSHGSRGCDLPALQSTGGSGLFYCFAE